LIPITALGICQFNDPLLFVFKVQEVMAFFEAIGERHLLFAKDIVAFFLFAK